MTTRSAVDTISGYFYQFDKTILEILKQKNSNQKVYIEAIEDIDVESGSELNAIQCKYHSKISFNPSAIKKPIGLMLKHFSESYPNKNYINYHLYGHFNNGHEKFKEIDLVALKNTYLTTIKREKDPSGVKVNTKIVLHEELNLDDKALEAFLAKLIVNINGPSLDDQLGEVMTQIAFALNVTSEEADYHYSASLKEVRRLSIQQGREERSTTKKAFLKKIQMPKQLFDLWFIKRKGRSEYIKYIKSTKLRAPLNIDPNQRFFLIDTCGEGNIAEFVNIAMSIKGKWSKVSKRPVSNYCPAIYFHNVDDRTLINLKNELYNKGVKFVDGYPFLNSTIRPDEFFITPTVENKISIRVVNSIEDVKSLVSSATGVVEVFSFYQEVEFFHSSEVKHTPIKIEDISYIAELIK